MFPSHDRGGSRKFNMKGIYEIRSKSTDKFYIGRSSCIEARISEHFTDLKYNRHHCKHLQNHYNKYGKDDLECFVIKECSNRDQMIIEEQKILDICNWNKSFNISKSADNGDGWNSIEIHMYNMNGKYLRSYDSASKAAIDNFNNPIVANNILKRTKVGNYLWSKEKVKQLDLKYKLTNLETGETVHFYYSGQIAEYLGLSYKSGTSVLKKFRELNSYKNHILEISPD